MGDDPNCGDSVWVLTRSDCARPSAVVLDRWILTADRINGFSTVEVGPYRLRVIVQRWPGLKKKEISE